MNNTKFAVRSFAVVLIVTSLFFTLGFALYSAQIVYGDDYAEQSQRKQAEIITVEVARGAILDRYGRVLVSNQVSYQITLNLDELGTATERNNSLAFLIDIATSAELTWEDSLNISETAPYTYLLPLRSDVFYGTYQNEEGEDYRVLTRLGRLAVQLKWIEDPSKDLTTEGNLPTATALVEKMLESFGLTEVEPEAQRQLLGLNYELYLRKYGIRYDEYVFLEEVPIEITVPVKERNYSGVKVEAVTQRIYGTDYAAHLLGRVGEMNETEWEKYQDLEEGYAYNDKVGKEGVELAFESYLRGEVGIQEVERNAQGNITASRWISEPVPGENVVLTLDIDLQKNVEDTLEKVIAMGTDKEFSGGACVLVEVDSGSVLAAGSYPTFNIATYGEDFSENIQNPQNPLFNRALQGTYAPGSTFKMVTAIAALEENIVTPYTTIRCDGIYDYYEDNGPACWIYNQFLGSHGNQNAAAAIKNSCNYYCYEVGRLMGIETLNAYANMFGLGVPSGSEIFEDYGVVGGPDYTESIGGTWYEGGTLSVSIGQENSRFTPLQLANYVATLVNGGTHYDAHFLQEVKTGDFSQVVYQYQPEENATKLNLSDDNVDAVKQGMRDLVLSGSVQANFTFLTQKGITVGAKTGTAQLTSVASSTANAVFVCFAPFENPEIAVAVVVEKGGSGNEAADIAAEVIDYYFSNQEARDEIWKENSLLP